MQRHARPGALQIIVLLALLVGAVTLAGPEMAPTGVAAPAASPANVTPQPGDDEVARAPAPAVHHLTAPTLFGVLDEAARPPMVDPASGSALVRRHGPATQPVGPVQGRAPPAITDR